MDEERVMLYCGRGSMPSEMQGPVMALTGDLISTQ